MNPKFSLSVNNLSEFDLYEEAIQKSTLTIPLPFVEILWDNYCHIDPELLLQYLSRFSDCVAFHVMWSKFLNLEEAEFECFLRRLLLHVNIMQPLYVSDHLCRFQLDGTHLFQAMEIPYTDLDAVCTRVDRYQEHLGTQVLFENHASTSSKGCRQVEFFEALIARTGCGIFFDISNARVAENNGVTAFADWLDLLRGSHELHCHVGSYSHNPRDGLDYDTHDSDVTDQTVEDVATVASLLNVSSLCYEREFRRTSQAMSRDLNLIQSSLMGGGTR